MNTIRYYNILIRFEASYWKFAKYLEFEWPALKKCFNPLLHWTIGALKKMSLHNHKNGLLSRTSGSHSSIPYVSFSTNYTPLGFINCWVLRFEIVRAICWRFWSSWMSPHDHSQILVVERAWCIRLQSSSRRLYGYCLTVYQLTGPNNPEDRELPATAHAFPPRDTRRQSSGTWFLVDCFNFTNVSP